MLRMREAKAKKPKTKNKKPHKPTGTTKQHEKAYTPPFCSLLKYLGSMLGNFLHARSLRAARKPRPPRTIEATAFLFFACQHGEGEAVSRTAPWRAAASISGKGFTGRAATPPAPGQPFAAPAPISVSLEGSLCKSGVHGRCGPRNLSDSFAVGWIMLGLLFLLEN